MKLLNILRFLRMAWMLAQTGAWQAPEETAWTDMDASALRSYLAGAPGKRLCNRLRYVSAALNASAVQAPNKWKAGQAAGYMLAVSHIQTLSAPIAPQDDPSEEQDNDETSPLFDHIVS